MVGLARLLPSENSELLHCRRFPMTKQSSHDRQVELHGEASQRTNSLAEAFQAWLSGFQVIKGLTSWNAPLQPH